MLAVFTNILEDIHMKFIDVKEIYSVEEINYLNHLCMELNIYYGIRG